MPWRSFNGRRDDADRMDGFLADRPRPASAYGVPPAAEAVKAGDRLTDTDHEN
jgi:hypothetical protein